MQQAVNQTTAAFQRCGSWLHEVGMVSDPAVRRAKRLAMAELLKPARDLAALSSGKGAGVGP